MGNTFGHLFRVTTWGESHGAAIGAVIDGCPALVPLSEGDIQPDLDRRAPGQSALVSQRKESDTVRILSGVFEGQTLGTPVSLYIVNEDMRPGDYRDVQEKYRPSHADYTCEAKYGVRDWRGGGRTSARETAGRVAAGAIALTPFGHMIYATPLRWVIILSPLAFVLLIGARAHTMSAATVRNLFLAFAAVMGLSMSSLLIVFTGVSIARVFFITAAAFGGLSLYGYMTQRDLSAFGSFLVMGVIGLVIAGLVNLFLQSTGLQFALSILAVLIFSGLTAWDTQSIKDMYYQADGYEVAQKKSVFGALSLYLDFINMFQSLLFLFGQRNN